MRKAEKEIRSKFDDSKIAGKVLGEIIEMDNDIAIKKVVFIEDETKDYKILVDKILMQNSRKIKENTFVYDTLREGTRILDVDNKLKYKVKLSVAYDTDRINLVNKTVSKNGIVNCATTFIYKDTLDKIAKVY